MHYLLTLEVQMQSSLFGNSLGEVTGQASGKETVSQWKKTQLYERQTKLNFALPAAQESQRYFYTLLTLAAMVKTVKCKNQ